MDAHFGTDFTPPVLVTGQHQQFLSCAPAEHEVRKELLVPCCPISRVWKEKSRRESCRLDCPGLMNHLHVLTNKKSAILHKLTFTLSSGLLGDTGYVQWQSTIVACHPFPGALIFLHATYLDFLCPKAFPRLWVPMPWLSKPLIVPWVTQHPKTCFFFFWKKTCPGMGVVWCTH